MNAARLPDELMKPKPRHVADLLKGETGYITFTELFVMSDRACFLNLGAELHDMGRSRVQVRVLDDGSFHVVVPSDISYEPGKPSPGPNAKLQPVASIAIGPPALR